MFSLKSLALHIRSQSSEVFKQMIDLDDCPVSFFSFLDKETSLFFTDIE